MCVAEPGYMLVCWDGVDFAIRGRVRGQLYIAEPGYMLVCWDRVGLGLCRWDVGPGVCHGAWLHAGVLDQ